MARIIEKPFDATKKIDRTQFKGAPNLITTSDLNRQIDALKYQLDLLDAKTAVVSDLSAVIMQPNDKTILTVTFTYMEVNGVSFSPAQITQQEVENPDVKTKYLLLTAKKKLVTYDDDFSHDIAGAKFVDGTSMPSANQWVYYDEKIVLSDTPDVDNKVAMLGEFNGNKTVLSVWESALNCIPKGKSLYQSLASADQILYREILDLKEYVNGRLDRFEKIFPVESKSLGNSCRFTLSEEDVSGLKDDDAITLVLPYVALMDTGVGSATNLEITTVVSTVSAQVTKPVSVMLAEDVRKETVAIGNYSKQDRTFTLGFPDGITIGAVASPYFKVVSLPSQNQ